MKRCPECRRDYYDDTLSFCLEDGTPLVYGVSADEPDRDRDVLRSAERIADKASDQHDGPDRDLSYRSGGGASKDFGELS